MHTGMCIYISVGRIELLIFYEEMHIAKDIVKFAFLT
jgi:hypothetical protein